MEDRIPKSVDNLIARYIRSVGHLEVLLFLFRYPDRPWSADEISREMRTNVSYAEQQLADLNGLVKLAEDVPRKYIFSADDELRSAVAQLNDLYASHRHALINAIYSKPDDAIRSFADSFRFKKD